VHHAFVVARAVTLRTEATVPLELAPLAHWCTIQSLDTSRIASAAVRQ
jgi:hypothetical protein